MKKSHRYTLVVTTIITVLSLVFSNAVALEMNIYGVGHLSIDSNNDGADSQVYVASNSSRLGFKGNQSLNNDLKAIFQFESGVDLSGRGNNDGNGGGTSNNLFSTARDSYVGLGGNFGTVIAGRLGVLNQWLYDFNLFADQVGDLGNIWGGTGLPGRANGVVAYASPDLGNGFDGLLAYIPENGTRGEDAQIIKVNYNNSAGLKLGAVYTSVGQGTGKSKHKASAITVNYGKGDIAFGGGYQIESDIGGTANNDRDSYNIGASFKLGNGMLKAQYTLSDANLANADANQIAVGYDYTLDKAITIYLAYASTDNDSNAAFTANNYGHGQAVSPVVGNDPSSISLGMVYKFDVKLGK